jgi:hypothetical protein
MRPLLCRRAKNVDGADGFGSMVLADMTKEQTP